MVNIAQGFLHEIKSKIALNQPLSEYERCYYLLFGDWNEVKAFLKREAETDKYEN